MMLPDKIATISTSAIPTGKLLTYDRSTLASVPRGTTFTTDADFPLTKISTPTNGRLIFISWLVVKNTGDTSPGFFLLSFPTENLNVLTSPCWPCIVPFIKTFFLEPEGMSPSFHVKFRDPAFGSEVAKINPNGYSALRRTS